MNCTVLMPYPPPVNNLFVNRPRGGRFPSKRYVEWQAEALMMLNKQELPTTPIEESVTLEMSVGRPDKRKRDISNLIKAPEDMLVKAGILKDDSQVEDLRIKWDSEVVGIQVDVWQQK